MAGLRCLRIQSRAMNLFNNLISNELKFYQKPLKMK